ncbi:MAG: hypothetical protein K9M84_11750 [Spirochaetia bacterium]|nr:hypothetical protein [Spirochaetia bacterium]
MFHSTSFELGRDYTENPGMLSVDGFNMGEIIIFGLQPQKPFWIQSTYSMREIREERWSVSCIREYAIFYDMVDEKRVPARDLKASRGGRSSGRGCFIPGCLWLTF